MNKRPLSLILFTKLCHIQVLIPQLKILTDQQVSETSSLTKSCLQAEDALRQGMEKLQQNLFESVVAGQLSEGSYPLQMTAAMERLEALISFVNQVTYFLSSCVHKMCSFIIILFGHLNLPCPMSEVEAMCVRERPSS